MNHSKATILHIAEFSLYLQELKLMVPAVKGYCAILNHVFSLASKDLAVSHITSRIIQHYPVNII